MQLVSQVNFVLKSDNVISNFFSLWKYSNTEDKYINRVFLRHDYFLP